MLKHRALLSVIITISIIFISSCIEPPDQFISPTYDIDLNFPVTDSLFTIDDFLGDDSNFVASTDPNKLGLLYYIKTNNIESFYVEDNLRFSGIEASSSTTIGSIKIKDTPYIEANIALSDIAPISEGSDVIFPPLSSPVNTEFGQINDFVSADFESGNIELTVKNNLPVPIEFKDIKIKNSIDDSIVAEFPPSSVVVVLPFDSSQVLLPIADKHITDRLKVEGNIYTEGSNGQIVTVPIGAGITVSLRFTDFVLDRVTAALPAQEEIEMDSSIVINDSTKLELAIFDNGGVTFVINNFIDLDINVWFQIYNLKKPDGSPYTETFVVERNSTNQTFHIESLKGWKIESDNPGELLEELKYVIKISSEETEDQRTISQRDSVNVSFNLSDAELSYAKGQIKPITFEIPESELLIDLGDIEDKISYDSLFINDPALKLKINSSINFDVLLNGKIIGISDKITRELPILMELPSLVNAEFDLRDQGMKEFINSFTTAGAIPTKFIFSGNGIVNPHYTIGSVSKTDSVFGTTNFELPFDLGIVGGSFSDTVHINELNLSEDEIESINSIFLTVETNNKIPVNLIMNGSVIDIDGNSLMKIPPSYNLVDYLVIEAPEVDGNGEVVSSIPYKQEIELRSAEAQEFIRNPNIVLSLMFGTPPLNSLEIVKFKTTDNINFKVYGKINYRVNN